MIKIRWWGIIQNLGANNYQPASFSSAFKLSGTACLVGVGVGGGSSLLRFGTCNERGHYLSPPSPPVALSFHTCTVSLAPHRAIKSNLPSKIWE